MKYIIIILALIVVGCNGNKRNDQQGMIHKVDSVVKDFFTTDTLVLRDTLITTDTITVTNLLTVKDTVYIDETRLLDSLIRAEQTVYNQYFIIQKIYKSTKHACCPYRVTTLVSPLNISKTIKFWEVYASDCKLNWATNDLKIQARNYIDGK